MSEEVDSSKVVGGVVSVILFFSFVYLVIVEPFPSSHLVHEEMIPKNQPSGIGKSVSGFLWDFRGFDMLFQTIVLFITAISCLALLREALI